ncbi:hypothetical protein QUA08_17895 [Microcoleus sp. T3B2]|uniref:hypothetical protein n=1 Tax=Microcoleus sp. T3B2 TaxID=3055426 RepID=UPI002FCE89FB
MEQAEKPVHKKLIENGATSQFDRTWGHYSNSIALGGITAIRSHFDPKRKFDRPI